MASAKTMAKSVFSIATNITSGSEEGGSDSEEEMDGTSGVEIAGMEMFEEEGQNLTKNLRKHCFRHSHSARSCVNARVA